MVVMMPETKPVASRRTLTTGARQFVVQLAHFRQTADQLVENGRLVELLVGFGFDVHRLGFGFALLEDDLGFRLALRADAGGAGLAVPAPAVFFLHRPAGP